MRLSGGEVDAVAAVAAMATTTAAARSARFLIGHLKQSSPGVPRGGQGGMERAARVNASQVTTFDRSYERKDRP
ncbi:hypothetical protein SCALM49S_08887 [Streptomyces californicus]